MSREATGQFGATLGSSAYWDRINNTSILRGIMGTSAKTSYYAMLQEVGTRASAAIGEIYQDLSDHSGQIRYIPVSDRNALAKQVSGLYDICKMAGTSSGRSDDCINGLNLSFLSPWNNPFRDESAIASAISMIGKQSRYPGSDALKLLQEASRWSISFAAGNDKEKQAFLEGIAQGKDSNFLKDVAEEYQNQTSNQSHTGKCGYSIGCSAYLNHIESLVFGASLPLANSATFGNPDYAGLLRDALRSVVDQLEYDLDTAARQNDYITDETADELKEVLDDLTRCGISTSSIYGKVEKLTWFVGGDPHTIFLLQRNLNKIGYSLTEDGVFGSKTLDAVNDFYNELVRGTFPTLAWVDPLQSKVTNIKFQKIGQDRYASFLDTSTRSKNINKKGVNRGITVFRADYHDDIGYHINTVYGESIKKGDYVPSSELQREIINKLNHTMIDERTYRFLKDFDVHAKRVRVAGRVLALTGAALDVVDILQTFHFDKNDADKKLGKTFNLKVATILGSWSMSALGAKGGAMLGAQVGSAIFPGPGTAIGGVVGGLVLGIAGSYSGSKLGEYVVDITALE